VAYGTGLALCLGTPGLISALLLSGAVPAGTQPLEGLIQQVGYLFTGLVFLSATWVWWRSAQVLRSFQAVSEADRPAVILREGLLSAVVLESSSLCGLAYWLLAGIQSPRHVWGFILMTPLLFLALVPRYARWAGALET
jgi:hypothetical protein